MEKYMKVQDISCPMCGNPLCLDDEDHQQFFFSCKHGHTISFYEELGEFVAVEKLKNMLGGKFSYSIENSLASIINNSVSVKDYSEIVKSVQIVRNQFRELTERKNSLRIGLLSAINYLEAAFTIVSNHRYTDRHGDSGTFKRVLYNLKTIAKEEDDG